MLAPGDEPTPTPAVSHAIVTHNRPGGQGSPVDGRAGRLANRFADGIVITPSHNPPRDGGFKYNPPHGGPAGDDVTRTIQAAANAYLDGSLAGVHRMPHAQALAAATTHSHHYRAHYVADLGHVIDMEAIRSAGLHLGLTSPLSMRSSIRPSASCRWTGTARSAWIRRRLMPCST